jgi:hypothetical protein
MFVASRASRTIVWMAATIGRFGRIVPALTTVAAGTRHGAVLLIQRHFQVPRQPRIAGETVDITLVQPQSADMESIMVKQTHCAGPGRLKSSRARCRGGLSLLEFLGCIIAIVGGALLGAMYLGVDVKQVAYKALSDAELLEKMPADWRPDDPREKGVTREQLLATLRDELGSLRREISALRGGSLSGEAAEHALGVSATGEDPAPTTKEETLAYWERLNEIAQSEAQLQKDAETTFSNSNAAKIFAIKGRVSRFAAKSVEAVPKKGVDESVVKFGRHLGLWYDRAGELYERAVRIWETPIGQQARIQLNEEWKRSDLQHRNESTLLYEKAAAVRSSVSRIFGAEFPEFAVQAEPKKPAAPAANAG